MVESFLLSTITYIIKTTTELKTCGNFYFTTLADFTPAFAHAIHTQAAIVAPVFTVITPHIFGIIKIELVSNLLSNFIGSHHFVCPPFLFVVFSIPYLGDFVNP
jgi:hypothetical protein